MTREDRGQVASGGASLGIALTLAGVPQAVAAREADEARIAFSSLGYTLPVIEVRGPRLVVARSHKVVDGQVVRAEALGFDQRDAEQRLISVLTRR